MGEVFKFPSRGRSSPNASCPPPKNDGWKVITITASDQDDAYDVRAWTGRPDDPATATMYLGPRATLEEAADLAREKAQALKIDEIVDCSTSKPPGPGDAA